MYELTLKIADLNVQIETHFSFMEKFCENYLCEKGINDLQVKVERIPKEEIKEELLAATDSSSIEYIECLQIYRRIAEQLPKYERCVVHGAAISYRNKAFLFVAPSGTGKSTHIRLWHRYLGDAIGIINGDKPILHIAKNEVNVYGTPWAGKEGWQKNVCVPLDAICFLKQSETNKVIEINPNDYIANILQQVYMPNDEEMMRRTLELISVMMDKVRFYMVYCNISEDAVKTVFEKITDESYKKGERIDEN